MPSHPRSIDTASRERESEREREKKRDGKRERDEPTAWRRMPSRGEREDEEDNKNTNCPEKRESGGIRGARS